MINTNLWNRIRYTLYAPFYDYVAAFRHQRQRSVDRLKLRPGESVLIIGAGTGADLPFIPAGALVTAVDITPAMVERLLERARGLGRPVNAQVMDGQALDLPDSYFDAAILHLILAVIPDPLACLREAERVLKPGGRASVFDKWLPDRERPSLGRRLLNLATYTLFSDINRQLGPIVAATSMVEEGREPAGFGGFFQISLLRKPV